MTPCIRTIRGVFAAAALALVLGAAPAPASAGDPPGMQRRVALVAREQPLASFLQELFAHGDAPVSVSPALQGVVNGRFEGTVQSVFKDIARSFSLSAYHDGAAVHLYPASEVGTRTYATDPAQAARLQATAAELSLPNARNTLRATQSGTLVAVGGPRFLQQIDELVKADGARAAVQVAPMQAAPAPSPLSGSPPIGFRVFFLKHAWAQDTRLAFGGKQLVVPGVATVLRGVTAGLGVTVAQPLPPGASLGATDPGATTAGADRALPQTQPRLRGSGLAEAGRLPPMGDGTEIPAGARTRSGAAVPAATLGADGSLLIPQRYVVNQIGAARIEVDPRSNAVIVRDLAERLPMYEDLVAALDRPPQMVEVEATIVDVNVSRLEQLGINWRWVNGRNDVLFGNGTASDRLLAAGQQITPVGQGGFVSTVLGSGANFISRINALAADGAARVVSRPQLVTLSNVEALFDSNQTFYVRVAGREEVDLFNVSAGTSLRVTPNVFREPDGWRIKLMVSIEDGRVSDRTVDAIPVVDRSSINTQALILEGESLLIGGMTRESRERNVDKVPGLGDLPGVGALFRTRTDSTQRIERMVLITPRRVSPDRALAPVSNAPALPDATGGSALREAPAAVPKGAPAPTASTAPTVVTAVPAPVAAPAPAAAMPQAPAAAGGALGAVPTIVVAPSVQTWSSARRPATRADHGPEAACTSEGGRRC